MSEWSPWGEKFQNEGKRNPYLQLPHDIPGILAENLKMGQAEILVVLALFTQVRPGPSGTRVSPSQRQLANYAHCSTKTVRNTIDVMVNNGLEIVQKGDKRTGPAIYELSGFVEILRKIKDQKTIKQENAK